MSEEKSMNPVVAVGVLGAAAVGGIWALSTFGLLGTVVLGGLAVGGVVAHAALKGEPPLDAVKSVLSKVGGFFKSAFAGAKKAMGKASDWAEEQQARAEANVVVEKPSKLDGATSRVDFDNAVSPEAAAVIKASKAPKPRVPA